MKNPSASSDALRDPFQDLIGYQLRRASLLMASDLNDRLAGLDLTVTGLSVLLMIEANPGVSQTALAGALGIKRANLAPMVAAFAARDVIQRDPTDKRSHGLRLTDAGQALANVAWGHVRDSEARFAGAVTAENRAVLNAVVASVRRTVTAEACGPS